MTAFLSNQKLKQKALYLDQVFSFGLSRSGTVYLPRLKKLPIRPHFGRTYLSTWNIIHLSLIYLMLSKMHILHIQYCYIKCSSRQNNVYLAGKYQLYFILDWINTCFYHWLLQFSLISCYLLSTYLLLWGRIIKSLGLWGSI